MSAEGFGDALAGVVDRPPPPEGMTEVTSEQFFALLHAEKRDIMPSHAHRTFTTWESTGREVWGWSAPGWSNPGEHGPAYAVRSGVPKSSPDNTLGASPASDGERTP